MALDDTDRRRIFLATALTVLALPALWWANRSDTATTPTVAAAGVDIHASPNSHADEPDTDTAGPTTEPAVVSGSSALPGRAPSAKDPAPVFLDGPSSEPAAGVTEIAVPATPAAEPITITATFSRSLYGNSCIVPGVVNGTTVTVVNLDNDRSATCVTVPSPTGSADQMVLRTAMFSKLADLTDAPIPVEIRQ